MMKKLIAAGLMAATTITAFSPVMAQGRDENWSRRDGDRQASATVQDDRNANRSFRDNRQRGEDRPAPQRMTAPRSIAVGEPNPSTPQTRQNWRDDRRGDWRDDRREWQQARQDDRQDWRHERWNDRRTDSNQWRNNHRWDRDWRRDRRYDWRDYRSQYRDSYRIGRYNAPRGWYHGHQRFSVGIYLNGLLFSSHYWIDDPYRYRLPPAYGPLRWVRYYDDVLLVDIRNGYVVDVIYDFFW